MPLSCLLFLLIDTFHICSFLHAAWSFFTARSRTNAVTVHRAHWWWRAAPTIRAGGGRSTGRSRTLPPNSGSPSPGPRSPRRIVGQIGPGSYGELYTSCRFAVVTFTKCILFQFQHHPAWQFLCQAGGVRGLRSPSGQLSDPASNDPG